MHLLFYKQIDNHADINMNIHKREKKRFTSSHSRFVFFC